MVRKNLLQIFSILTIVFVLGPTPGRADEMSQALAAYQAGRYQEALKIWSPLAEKGDANAQLNLGMLYRNAQGVEQNDRLALVWLSRAAAQGLLDAQYNTGLMYMEGRGVASSKADAFQWWKLAAGKGHAESQHNLAVMYAYGIATGVDTNKALELWRLAAAQGHQGARQALFRTYSEGLFGMKPDPDQARQWQD